MVYFVSLILLQDVYAWSSNFTSKFTTWVVLCLNFTLKRLFGWIFCIGIRGITFWWIINFHSELENWFSMNWETAYTKNQFIALKKNISSFYNSYLTKEIDCCYSYFHWKLIFWFSFLVSKPNFLYKFENEPS